MSRITFAAAVVVASLLGGGCEQELSPLPLTLQDVNQSKPAQPQPAVEAAPAAPQPAPAEPNTTEPAKTQQTAPTPEPNVVEPPQPPIPEPAKPAEPNQPQVQPPPGAQAAQELCNGCAVILSKYVNDQGLVDYKALLRRKLELLEVLDRFKSLDRSVYDSWSEQDKVALWINAYNLQMMRIILDNYPIESSRMLRLFWPPNSIRHIKGIWDQHKFIIMDEEFTLQEIDRRFFRKEFSDPCVCFAVWYASLSSPPLRNEPYCGPKLSEQLDDQVRKFLAGSHAFRIDRDGGKVYLSSVLGPGWYGGQFVAQYGTDKKFKDQEPTVRAVLNFLGRYISQQDAAFLETGNYTVGFMSYDWGLNETNGQ